MAGADAQPLDDGCTGDALVEAVVQVDALAGADAQSLPVNVGAGPLALTVADVLALAAALPEAVPLAPPAGDADESALDAVADVSAVAVEAPEAEACVLTEGCRDALSRPLAEELAHSVPLALPAPVAEPSGDAVSEA